MIEATRAEAEALQSFLAARGVSVWLGSAWDTARAKARLGGTDLLLTVGGDGTILRAAQIVIPGRTPITGINLGKLGFMTELEAAGARAELPALLEKKGWLDERAMLKVTIAAPGRRARVYHALNDVVAARGEIVRAVQIEAAVDGRHLATYKADGVIAATATGSTGYALAAGGPVIHPSSRDFLLVPIAPHLNPGYPVVLPGTAELTLRVSAVHPAALSIDGHINLSLAGDDVITIRRSPHKIRFLRIRPAASFYGSLEEKLKGKR
jgi:NAD+ kinase